jgi:putative ABC transport system permease protein
MLMQDVRYAVRSLLKNRGFTAIAVACLALGIGVNSTIFSVVDGVILRPYPYPDADQIIVVSSTNQKEGVTRGGVSYADFKDLRDASSTIQTMAAFTERSLTIADGSSDPERFLGSPASWTLFHLLGTPPIEGRNFAADDDKPGAEPVVLLGYGIWERRYQKDRSVIGRAININGRPHTVIGVMPPKFMFPQNSKLWVPISAYQETAARNERGLQVFARMKPGISMHQADADLQGLATRLAASYPTQNADWGITIRDLSTWILPDDVKLVILTMMGAVTLVLLIACSNVANLLLARATARHREMAVRAALGAGRWRIVRQLLTESVLIGLLSAPLGIGIAYIGIKLLDSSMPPDEIPYFITWSLNARSLVYTIVIAMGTGIVFGLVPALQAVRSNLQSTLKEGGRGNAGGSRAYVRNGLVVVEIALSLVLLVGASLFVRSFLNLQTSTVGFDTAPLMTMRFALPGAAYEAVGAKARRVDDIVRRIEGLPGVQAAFASNFVPLGGGGGGGRVIVEGRSVERGKEPGINFTAVTPHVRETLGVELLRGRGFTEAEGATRSSQAQINKRMADVLWPDSDPVGRRFRLVGDAKEEWFTVIGVIADFRHFQGDSSEGPGPAAYVPYAYQETLNTGITIRVAGEPKQIIAAAREQIRLADPLLPVFDVSTMEELRQLSYWQYRLFGSMFSIFGVIALVLASIGVYGVLSYSVSQRVQEIGVRMALGAERRDVMRLIVGQGLKLAGIGVVGGIIGALGITPVIQTLLYNVTPTDPISFVGVAAFLSMVAIVASYIPARRAVAVDPIIALRND